mmetsp:Transcript_43079/g.80755  ORF Transcript_43079/g.80755 Transcript_43079/m.80755 type:complete len:184 (-) Transcript_43079:223-774(-)
MEPQGLAAFSFGQGPGSTPGGTNKALAWQMAQLLKYSNNKPTNLPIILAQWEIAKELQEVYGVAVDCVASPNPSGSYLSTFGVMEQFAYCLENRSIDSIVIIAHPDHAVRCGKTAEHFGYMAYSSPNSTVPWVRFKCDDNGYDAQSTQAWTTSRANYVPHELAARAKLVASGQISFLDKRTIS